MLAERLRCMREAVGYSIYALAHHTAVGVATISEIEHGKNVNPGIVTVGKLADALGCSLDYLAGRSEDWRVGTRPATRQRVRPTRASP